MKQEDGVILINALNDLLPDGWVCYLERDACLLGTTLRGWSSEELYAAERAQHSLLLKDARAWRALGSLRWWRRALVNRWIRKESEPEL